MTEATQAAAADTQADTEVDEPEVSFEESWMADEAVVEKPAEPEVLEPEPVKINEVIEAGRAAQAAAGQEYADAHAALGD